MFTFLAVGQSESCNRSCFIEFQSEFTSYIATAGRRQGFTGYVGIVIKVWWTLFNFVKNKTKFV